jgi:hypothetical protein
MDTVSASGPGIAQPPEILPAPVAVIAIHGVGQHVSGASANAVADLLLSMGRENGNGEQQGNERTGQLYSGFASTSIEVPLRKVESPLVVFRPFEFSKPTPLRPIKRAFLRLWGMFDERRGFLALRRRTPGPRLAPAAPRVQGEGEELPQTEALVDRGMFAFEFMRTQLTDYKGQLDRTFTTSRLEAVRAPNSPSVTVHVYDAHYSDLSKPEGNIAAFFFSFYQLLFHLGSLSLQAVYWAEAENAFTTRAWHRRMWHILSSLHATSVRVLVMVIPLLNLILLALGLCTFAEKIPPGTAETTLLRSALALFGLLGLIGAFLVGRVWPTSRRSVFWALVPAAGTAIGVVVLRETSHLLWMALYPNLGEGLVRLVFAWLIAAFALVTFVFKKLETVRRGALGLGVFLYVCNAMAFLYFLSKAAALRDETVRPHAVAVSALWAAQLLFAELRFFWVVGLGSAIVAALLGWLCVLQARDPRRRARARAAIRTGRFTIAVSAAVFLVVTVALWTGLTTYAASKISVFDKVPHTSYAPSPLASPALALFVPDVQGVEEWKCRVGQAPAQSANCQHPAHPWNSYLTGLLLMSFTSGLSFTLLLLFFGFFLLAWAVLPSVLYEIWPEWTIRQNVTNRRIRWLGNWLSRGLDSTAIVSRLAWIAIIPVPLLFGALDYLVRKNFLPASHWLSVFTIRLSGLSLLMINGIGVTFAVSGAAIFTILMKYGTTVLDTLLDVDNYLRTSPADGTPRARITERYVSILRYVAAYRDPQGRPYSRLVIVAHSLGSMVSTDLLRYLKHSTSTARDPELAPFGFDGGAPPAIPIFLLTLGSPIRQLLNRFFPHLYWWVRDTPDNSSSRTRLPDAAPPPIPPIPPFPLPDPAEAGVTGWVNAYRGGDYVGRSLWIDSWFSRNATPDSNPAWAAAARISLPPHGGGNVAEMCVGIGAHTHYWDRTAPDVASVLDRLITNPAGVFV